MRVLLDENIPHDLIAQFPGHDVVTVQRLGWAGLKNGDLLERGRGMIDAFITMERKLETQHDLTVLPLAWSSSWLTRTECLIFSRSWREYAKPLRELDRARLNTLAPNTRCTRRPLV